MRILTTLPQDDLNAVPAAEVAGYDGLVTSENKDLCRIPSAFTGYRTEW